MDSVSGSVVDDVSGGDDESLSSHSHCSALGNIGHLDDAELDLLCGNVASAVPLDGADHVPVSNVACEAVLAGTDIFEGGPINDSNDDESSIACSDELKPNAIDLTVDSESEEVGDDMHLGACMSSNKLFGVRGPKSLSVLEPNDCSKSVRLAHDIHVGDRNLDASRWSFLNVLKEEVDSVPADMFDALACALDDWRQLSRVLQLDWVKHWSGWHDIKTNLDGCTDAVLKKFLCDDAVK